MIWCASNGAVTSWLIELALPPVPNENGPLFITAGRSFVLSCGSIDEAGGLFHQRGELGDVIVKG